MCEQIAWTRNAHQRHPQKIWNTNNLNDKLWKKFRVTTEEILITVPNNYNIIDYGDPNLIWNQIKIP